MHFPHAALNGATLADADAQTDAGTRDIDAARIVLTAIRRWLQPCADADDGARCRRQSWRDVLAAAGLRADGLVHFDMLMRFLMCDTCHPLDTRCRCACGPMNDEARLLQALAHLQSTRSEAALRALADWLPRCADSGVLKIARWFSIALLDAGLAIRPPRTCTDERTEHAAGHAPILDARRSMSASECSSRCASHVRRALTRQSRRMRGNAKGARRAPRHARRAPRMRAPGPGRTIAALAAGQPPKFRGNAERRADDRLRSLCLRRSSSSGSGRPDGRPPYRTAGIARMRGACHFW